MLAILVYASINDDLEDDEVYGLDGIATFLSSKLDRSVLEHLLYILQL